MRQISALLLLLTLSLAVGAAPTVHVAKGIDHSAFDRLLSTYVDEQGLVDYAAWRANAADHASLRDYIRLLGTEPADPAEGADESATLVNAYNAFTIDWILRNYPTESIRRLDGSWDEKRWLLGGRKVSLGEIEHENLRKTFGWRAHAVLVCAARSCPPLQRTAFTAENLEELSGAAMRAWLSRSDLNVFEPAANIVRISEIFSWFSGDFSDPGLPTILAEFAPSQHYGFLSAGRFKVRYLDYHWGLNDTSGAGKDYKHSFWKSLF